MLQNNNNRPNNNNNNIADTTVSWVLSRQQLMSNRSCCLQAINMGQAGSWIRPPASDQQSQQYRWPIARLLAVTSPHSGDWLNALPLSSCRPRLDDRAVQIAVGLRLGANICEPHQCPCKMQKGCMDCHVEGALVSPCDITASTIASGAPFQRPISRQSRSRRACSELTVSDPMVWR